MRTFLTAEWRTLIMAQYEVSPNTLAPYMPRGVEVDLYQPAATASPRCYVLLAEASAVTVRSHTLQTP